MQIEFEKRHYRSRHETAPLAYKCKDLTQWKRPWWRERLKAGGEGDDRGRDGWMVPPTRWSWVWASSRRWWKTGKPVCELNGLAFKEVPGDGEGQGSLVGAVHRVTKSWTRLSDSTTITNLYYLHYVHHTMKLSAVKWGMHVHYNLVLNFYWHIVA